MPQSRVRKTRRTSDSRVISRDAEVERQATSDEDIEAAIFALVNQERQRRGIPLGRLQSRE